jgi:hypothetical protein
MKKQIALHKNLIIIFTIIFSFYFISIVKASGNIDLVQNIEAGTLEGIIGGFEQKAYFDGCRIEVDNGTRLTNQQFKNLKGEFIDALGNIYFSNKIAVGSEGLHESQVLDIYQFQFNKGYRDSELLNFIIPEGYGSGPAEIFKKIIIINPNKSISFEIYGLDFQELHGYKVICSLKDESQTIFEITSENMNPRQDAPKPTKNMEENNIRKVATNQNYWYVGITGALLVLLSMVVLMRMVSRYKNHE